MNTYIIPVSKDNRILSYVTRAVDKATAIKEAQSHGYIVIGKTIERRV